ncbi:MAG: hypothetical protein M3Y48_18485 [Actinomycetota bacterium]|nr:hypothetical protein [Actinomycetota bacterium]
MTLNNQPLARRVYREAALLADSAGACEQRARVYVNLAQQSTHLARVTGRRGFAREALRFIDRATDAARHQRSPVLHALISLRQALAHAQLGDDVAFRSTITTARRELDRGPHEADPTWTRFVSHSEITGYEAMGRARFGAPDQATRLYHEVLEDTARSPRDLAYYRALLAGTLVQSGAHDQAISHGLTVLTDLGTTMTSVRVLRELRSVRDAAGGAGGAEFCDRFDTVARALSTV